MKPGPKFADVPSRFWANVQKGDADECWPWNAAADQHGYGRMHAFGIARKATHVALYLQSGTWPTQDVLHSCDYPSCVNPAHLSEGSHARNMREAADRGRLPQGERRNVSKLTNAQAAEIRQRSIDGESLKALASEFRVSYQTVWRIYEGLTWNYILKTKPNPHKRQLKRLTPEQRSEIRVRAIAGEKLADLAKEFGVGFNTVWRIRDNLTWKHLPPEFEAMREAVKSLDEVAESEVVQ